jgi:thiol:disulfide interchange protein DsbD
VETVVVAADFEVQDGEHFSAMEGKGRGGAPRITWKNAEVLDIVWPQSVDIAGPDGLPSGYKGYTSSFSVFYKLRILDKDSPVSYDMFYVVCSNSCIPQHKAGVLALNEMLTQEDLDGINWSNVEKPSDAQSGFLLVLLFGLLGGVILNCMPCVFPVILIKIFTLMKVSDGMRRNIRIHGLASLLGMVSVFVILGTILSVLRPAISGLGWGFHMQNPIVVYLMLLTFFACSLHFWGLLKFSISGLPRVKLEVNNKYVMSFLSGALGGLASSACVGPFSGVAIASALLNSSFAQSIAVFTAIGIGAGVPFLGLSIFPGIINKLPKPGKWLATFEEFMGFAMLLSCTWPIWILLSQISPAKVMLVISCCIVISLFAWLLNRFGSSRIFRGVALAGICISVLSGGYLTSGSKSNKEEIPWISYSDKVVDDAKAWGEAIFLNFTASWCLNCQFNETAFEDDDIIFEFQKRKIKAVKCDWTNKSDKIADMIKEYGAAAVPLYVYYPGKGKDFIVLPSILKKQTLLDAFAKGDSM